MQLSQEEVFVYLYNAGVAKLLMGDQIIKDFEPGLTLYLYPRETLV